MKFLTIIVFAAGFISANSQTVTSPEEIGKRVISELISRPDFMMYRTETVRGVHYAEACAGFGAARLAGLLNEKDLLRQLEDRYLRVIDDTIENTSNHVDVNVYGILPLELYMQGKNDKFLQQGIEFADDEWKDPLPDGLTRLTRFWIDDIWMIGALQVQAFRVTANNIYLERAALEIEAYITKLQQPNGLFYHGLEYPFFWGRGNGWVAAGLAELLSVLQEENPHYGVIRQGYEKMMYTLLKYQDADGMWHQLIDHPESYKETSSTAMFGYAITTGYKKGLLPADLFRPASEKAWSGLLGYIEPDGKLRDVCVGTGQTNDVNFYLTRPKSTGDLHGQAPLLWFAYSMLMN
jgi:rhamnogalacturonyl hydrolase YesR